MYCLFVAVFPHDHNTPARFDIVVFALVLFSHAAHYKLKPKSLNPKRKDPVAQVKHLRSIKSPWDVQRVLRKSTSCLRSSHSSQTVNPKP